MRDDYAAFTARDAEILSIGPDDARKHILYWKRENLPFIGLPDPTHKVANLYDQEVNLFKLGRMPAVVVVDKLGIIRYEHHGNDMQDIPANQVILDILDGLNQI